MQKREMKLHSRITETPEQGVTSFTSTLVVASSQFPPIASCNGIPKSSGRGPKKQEPIKNGRVKLDQHMHQAHHLFRTASTVIPTLPKPTSHHSFNPTSVYPVLSPSTPIQPYSPQPFSPRSKPSQYSLIHSNTITKKNALDQSKNEKFIHSPLIINNQNKLQ